MKNQYKNQTYEKPTLKILNFTCEDVITTSGCSPHRGCIINASEDFYKQDVF